MTLKPCPFCGGEAQMMDTVSLGPCHIRCKECGIITRPYFDSDEAAAAWNKRQGEGLTDNVKKFDDVMDDVIKAAQHMRDYVESIKPIPAPPVVEWEDNFGKAGEYEVLISYLRNMNHPYFVKLIFRGVEIDKWQEVESYPARLAAENAILRHWAEQITKR